MANIWQRIGDELPRTHNPVTRVIGRLAFRIMGWRIEGELPNRSKFVVALTPHTSNMDFILTVAFLWGSGLKASFLMKHSLFWFPLGSLLRRLGGIPVDRSAPQGLVERMAEEFQARKRLVLGITPEGTRSGVRRWKEGFARIAAAADVPVLPAVLNYRTKTVVLAPLVAGAQTAEAILTAVQAVSQQGVPRH